MTTDALSFLADSPVRGQLLGALSATESARPSDLRDELEVSRATIHRNLSALTERGWVRQVDDGYVATTAGELVHDHFGSFRRGLETVDRFEPLLEVIPADGVPPLEALASAELVTAAADQPHAPVMRYVEELMASDTDAVRGVTPVRSEMFSHGHEQLLEAGVETELVLPVDVLERQREEAGEDLAEALETDGFDVYTVPESPGFGLSVTDDRAFLGGYGADNQLEALAVSDAEPFRSWATERFERMRARAAPAQGQRAETDAVSGRD